MSGQCFKKNFYNKICPLSRAPTKTSKESYRSHRPFKIFKHINYVNLCFKKIFFRKFEKSHQKNTISSMQKQTFQILIGVCIFIILGTATFIFWPTITDQIADLRSGTETTVKKKKGVTRKISYLGRIREAKKLIEHEYFTLATLELLQAIKEKPDLAEPYLILGEIYLRTNDSKKLGNLILQLDSKFPDHPQNVVLEARRLIAQGAFYQVLTSLNNAGDNLSPDLRFYKAVLKALQNAHTQARETLRELEVLPVAPKGFEITGEGIQSKKVDDEGKEYISAEFAQKVTEFSTIYDEFDELAEGKNPHLFALFAKALAKNNETRLAREFADTAIKEDVGYIDAWILRGYANLQLKDIQNAIQDLRHAYELDPVRPQTHYFLALALHESGNDNEAVLFFEKALEHKFEFSDEVRWKLVELFTAQKKYDRVVELYKELLDEGTAQTKFVSAMFTTINLIKKPDIALELTEKLIVEKPEDVFLLNMHGWALLANKELDRAEEVLEKAESLDAQNARTALNFGILYEAQNRIEKAKDAYQKSYEQGQRTSQISISNLAAEKYNALLLREEKGPVQLEAGDRPKHSP